MLPCTIGGLMRLGWLVVLGAITAAVFAIPPLAIDA
jgi:hypothetical protein